MYELTQHDHHGLIEVGDTVMVRMDDGTEKEFTVKYKPWMLGHGKWVIGLRGILGGYDLDRVLRITKPNGGSPCPANT